MYRVLQKERKKLEAFFVMKLQSNYYFDHKLLFVIFIHLLLTTTTHHQCLLIEPKEVLKKNLELLKMENCWNI